jgi:hypothetical protein
MSRPRSCPGDDGPGSCLERPQGYGGTRSHGLIADVRPKAVGLYQPGGRLLPSGYARPDGVFACGCAAFRDTMSHAVGGGLRHPVDHLQP